MSTVQKSDGISQKQKSFRFLPKTWITFALNNFNKISSFLADLNISPNVLSVIGLIAGLGAGILIFFKRPFWAGILIIICGMFDVFDGQVAVKANKKTVYGAIFDSVLDRYSESFIYMALAFHFKNHWAFWIALFAFLGSTMVSYSRARAEGLGIECKVGIMQRAERIILLSTGTIVGSLLNILDPALIAILILIALFSNITAIQRTLYLRKI